MQVKPFDSTSKILTWIILMFYLIMIIISIVCKIVLNTDVEFVLGYLQQLMVIIIVSYFGKSAVENFEKIRLSESHKKQD